MYRWGYIKNVALAKLDLDYDEKEADVHNLINRFEYYANEAMTQICSTVKPKYTFYDVVIKNRGAELNDGEFYVGETVRMPNDFVSFGDDINFVTYIDDYDETVVREANDEDFRYAGNNSLFFMNPGIYHISYNARWIDTFVSMDDSTQLDVPNDILDALPSYIASQCYKVDDEYKSSVFRNEFEIMLSRIDNTNYRNTKTIRIAGDW